MESRAKNGVATPSVGRSKTLEIREKPQRRRFPPEEKLRILRETDTCPHGTVGAVLRREGIYSSHLAAWRQARDRGDLDPKTLRERAKNRKQQESTNARVAELERENRKLRRQLRRAELISDIQKKTAALLGEELVTPESDESNS